MSNPLFDFGGVSDTFDFGGGAGASTRNNNDDGALPPLWDESATREVLNRKRKKPSSSSSPSRLMDGSSSSPAKRSNNSNNVNGSGSAALDDAAAAAAAQHEQSGGNSNSTHDDGSGTGTHGSRTNPPGSNRNNNLYSLGGDPYSGSGTNKGGSSTVDGSGDGSSGSPFGVDYGGLCGIGGGEQLGLFSCDLFGGGRESLGMSLDPTGLALRELLSTVEEWNRVEFSAFDLTRRLGAGRFGTVYRAKRVEGAPRAVKALVNEESDVKKMIASAVKQQVQERPPLRHHQHPQSFSHPSRGGGGGGGGGQQDDEQQQLSRTQSGRTTAKLVDIFMGTSPLLPSQGQQQRRAFSVDGESPQKDNNDDDDDDDDVPSGSSRSISPPLPAGGDRTLMIPSPPTAVGQSPASHRAMAAADALTELALPSTVAVKVVDCTTNIGDTMREWNVCKRRADFLRHTLEKLCRNVTASKETLQRWFSSSDAAILFNNNNDLGDRHQDARTPQPVRNSNSNNDHLQDGQQQQQQQQGGGETQTREDSCSPSFHLPRTTSTAASRSPSSRAAAENLISLLFMDLDGSRTPGAEAQRLRREGSLLLQQTNNSNSLLPTLTDPNQKSNAAEIAYAQLRWQSGDFFLVDVLGATVGPWFQRKGEPIEPATSSSAFSTTPPLSTTKSDAADKSGSAGVASFSTYTSSMSTSLARAKSQEQLQQQQKNQQQQEDSAAAATADEREVCPAIAPCSFGIVMELLSGSLGSICAERIAPKPQLSVRLAAAAAAMCGVALRYMHRELNYLHADIKLDNVLFNASSGVLRLGDFGCALPLEEFCGEGAPCGGDGDNQQQQQHKIYVVDESSSSSSSAVDTFAGSLISMAPERLGCTSNTRIGGAADIWSLGISLVHLLIGEHPMNVVDEVLGPVLMPPLSPLQDGGQQQQQQHQPPEHQPSSGALSSLAASSRQVSHVNLALLKGNNNSWSVHSAMGASTASAAGALAGILGPSGMLPRIPPVPTNNSKSPAATTSSSSGSGASGGGSSGGSVGLNSSALASGSSGANATVTTLGSMGSVPSSTTLGVLRIRLPGSQLDLRSSVGAGSRHHHVDNILDEESPLLPPGPAGGGGFHGRRSGVPVQHQQQPRVTASPASRGLTPTSTGAVTRAGTTATFDEDVFGPRVDAEESTSIKVAVGAGGGEQEDDDDEREEKQKQLQQEEESSSNTNKFSVAPLITVVNEHEPQAMSTEQRYWLMREKLGKVFCVRVQDPELEYIPKLNEGPLLYTKSRGRYSFHGAAGGSGAGGTGLLSDCLSNSESKSSGVSSYIDYSGAALQLGGTSVSVGATTTSSSGDGGSSGAGGGGGGEDGGGDMILLNCLQILVRRLSPLYGGNVPALANPKLLRLLQHCLESDPNKRIVDVSQDEFVREFLVGDDDKQQQQQQQQKAQQQPDQQQRQSNDDDASAFSNKTGTHDLLGGSGGQRHNNSETQPLNHSSSSTHGDSETSAGGPPPLATSATGAFDPDKSDAGPWTERRWASQRTAEPFHGSSAKLGVSMATTLLPPSTSAGSQSNSQMLDDDDVAVEYNVDDDDDIIPRGRRQSGRGEEQKQEQQQQQKDDGVVSKPKSSSSSTSTSQHDRLMLAAAAAARQVFRDLDLPINTTA